MAHKKSCPLYDLTYEVGSGQAIPDCTCRWKITIHKLPLKDYTSDGSYYAKVGKEKIGENGRAFFETPEEAFEVALKFLESRSSNENK